MFNKEKPVELIIDKDKCSNCAQCVDICPGEYLVMQDGEIKASNDSPFGCIQCGHCMSTCPNDCLEIKGEGISKDDIFPLGEKYPDYDNLNNLFKRRRSTRKFKKQEVPREIIDKILEAASTAPISVPPSEVKVLVINGYDEMKSFTDEMINGFEKMLKFMDSFILTLMKPVFGKVGHKMMKEFVIPLVKLVLEGRKQGKDYLFFDAPALIMFNGTELADKEDQVLASTHAQIAAEALGLGTCVIGSVPPVIERSSAIKEKYGIQKGDKLGMAFVLGYPNTSFKKGVKRHFKDVSYYGN